MIKINTLALVVFFLLFASACKENPTTNDNTTIPQILSLTSDKTDIQYGGNDPAIITCSASGGEIKYKWDVDLGDIIPMNSDGSVVRFTGSPCCIGKKYIKCTVSNDKGTAKDTIVINIVKPN